MIQFRAETLQCRVSLNPASMQSLHLKLSPPGPPEQWSPDELQLLERYFDTKVRLEQNGFICSIQLFA